jgi:hypothetical protein
MIAQPQRSFCTLLALLLALASLTAPGAQAAPPAPAPAQTGQTAQDTMPQGLMSAFLEASSAPFTASPDGYRARSGGLDFTLRASGLQANGNGLAWRLALSGFGRGEQIASLPDAEIPQTASRLEYRRGALTEWYRDTALGLEQGFTIHQAPRGAGPLVLQLDLSTDLAGAPDADGRGLSFAAPDGQTLRYDHLRTWDASGAQLETKLVYARGQIILRVNDEGAAYPLTIDPLIYVEQKVIASGAANDNFGYSVALDGDTALVGAARDDVGANTDQGSAYVFTRSGTTWRLQQKLTASDGAASDQFGSSVALSGDTALVGAYYDDVGANANQGSAYVFTRTGTTWSQQQQLTASDGAANDYFGSSVALSGDTALVGASYDAVGQGSAYVFTRTGTTWSQQQKLTASDGAADDYFGTVALSGDTALVGAPHDDVGANGNQGSAYVFTRSDTTWSQKQKLTASDGAAENYFGYSVGLSGDTALVGAYGDDVGAKGLQGSAYVFTRTGTTWSQQGQLTASDGAAQDWFGYSVALSGDTALVGAFYDDVGANANQGSAYVFTRSETTWSQQAQLTASDGAAWDFFGYSVALSGDTALVGAYYDWVGANHNQGSAYVFTRTDTTWSQQLQLIASDGATYDYFGTSVALEGDTALVGAYGDDVGANTDQGSAYFYTFSLKSYVPLVLKKR